MESENRYKKLREDFEFKPNGYRITQDDLANIFKKRGYESLGSRSIIGKIETGKRDVSPYELKGYCEVFNTTSDYLLEIRDTQQKDEDIAMISKTTGLNEDSINTLKILKNSEYMDILNYIMSDYFSFGDFLYNINLYLDNEFDTPIHFDEKTHRYVESIDNISNNPILITDKEKYISIGKKLSNKPSDYKMIFVPVSILESHAMQQIQAQLNKWKREYKEGK